MENDGVELVGLGPLKVVVNVTLPGGVKRTVTFMSAPEGLRWKTHMHVEGRFICKHCVAAGIVTWNEAPGAGEANQLPILPNTVSKNSPLSRANLTTSSF